MARPFLPGTFGLSVGRKGSGQDVCCPERGKTTAFSMPRVTILLYSMYFQDILDFIKQAQERVLSHQEEQALLKAYIAEWRKFFTQCGYLPMPFGQLETALQGKTTTSVQRGKLAEDSVVRKLMLDSWNQVALKGLLLTSRLLNLPSFILFSQSIFSNIKDRLQGSAMKLVHNERNGEAFDSQLVIGVRESYVNLCSNSEDKLQIYRDNFEKAYIDATEQFYSAKAPDFLSANGVQEYMKYADAKVRSNIFQFDVVSLYWE